MIGDRELHSRSFILQQPFQPLWADIHQNISHLDYIYLQASARLPAQQATIPRERSIAETLSLQIKIYIQRQEIFLEASDGRGGNISTGTKSRQGIVKVVTSWQDQEKVQAMTPLWYIPPNFRSTPPPRKVEYRLFLNHVT
jgi:hypothetical protein